MSFKTKADKYVIKKLNNYSKEELNKFEINKQVYYDSMEKVIEILNNAYEERSGQGIEELIKNIELLKKEKESVSEVLKDVEQTIEFYVD